MSSGNPFSGPVRVAHGQYRSKACESHQSAAYFKKSRGVDRCTRHFRGRHIMHSRSMAEAWSRRSDEYAPPYCCRIKRNTPEPFLLCRPSPPFFAFYLIGTRPLDSGRLGAGNRQGPFLTCRGNRCFRRDRQKLKDIGGILADAMISDYKLGPGSTRRSDDHNREAQPKRGGTSRHKGVRHAA